MFFVEQTATDSLLLVHPNSEKLIHRLRWKWDLPSELPRASANLRCDIQAVLPCSFGESKKKSLSRTNISSKDIFTSITLGYPMFLYPCSTSPCVPVGSVWCSCSPGYSGGAPDGARRWPRSEVVSQVRPRLEGIQNKDLGSPGSVSLEKEDNLRVDGVVLTIDSLHFFVYLYLLLIIDSSHGFSHLNCWNCGGVPPCPSGPIRYNP